MNFNFQSRRLELQIATQCAPLLAGLKPSNLLIIPETEKDNLDKALKNTRLSYFRLSEKDGREVYLLYRGNELVCFLTDRKVQELLQELGYTQPELPKLLKVIGEKYEAHQTYGMEFPHELGLVLGYPVVDVRGFMQNDGKNFLYSGYWKVYGNLKGARQLFKEFGRAKELAIELALIGYGVADIVNYCQGRRALRPAV